MFNSVEFLWISEIAEGSDPNRIMSFVQHLMSMLQGGHRHDSAEGGATAAEKELVMQRNTALATVLVRQSLALEATRVCSVLRQAAPALPVEVLLAIAEHRLSSPPFVGCCCCEESRCAHVHWSDAPDTRAVCAGCGHMRTVTTRPVVPFEAESWALRTARVSLLKRPTWKPCRHFHREGEGLRAVRHRGSGLHSFRTIVCGEWITRGTVTYELHFPRLQAPCAVGIGVVNPQSAVNRDIAWCPGTGPWEDAYGLCIEGVEVDSERSIRALGEDARAAFGGNGTTFAVRGSTGTTSTCADESALPALRQGDVFRVTVDATERALIIRRRVPIDDSEMSDAAPHVHEWEPAICLRLNDGDGSSSEPLALTVSLKYASDECHLIARD